MPSQDMKIMHLLPHKEKRTENIQSSVLVRQLPESRSSKKAPSPPATARPAKGRCKALASFHGARSQTSLSSSFVSSTGIANTGAGIADVADGRAAILRRTGHARAHHFNLPLAVGRDAALCSEAVIPLTANLGRSGDGYEGPQRIESGLYRAGIERRILSTSSSSGWAFE